MGEKFIPAKLPEGDMVINGKISLNISPSIIEAIIIKNPIPDHNSEFNDYSQLRLAEHGLAYEVMKNNQSAQEDERLKSIRVGIAEFEEENPTFQKKFTDDLNSIIDKYR